uniref:Rho guanine nucleotide exchange factor (GEF) 15 n=1 Tax=Nothobranchius kuhntae TaxID=321403 RepID=A0A1A8I2M6_NOTKU
MSEQETAMSLAKSGPRPKPDVHPRVFQQNHSYTPADGANTSGLPEGKVMKMVNKIYKQDHREVEERATNAYTELPSAKKASVIKATAQYPTNAEEVPPLPKKRSCFPKSKERSVGGKASQDSSVEGGRSAPDGKEVEAQVNGDDETEVEHGLEVLFCSNQSCSCVCHLQRPGMMLIWVHVEPETVEEWNNVKKQTPKVEEACEEEEEKEEEEVDKSAVEKKTIVNQAKHDFLQNLEGVLAEQHRNSDQGPPAAKNTPKSPAVPPKPAPSPPVQETSSQEEEENIYEVYLPTAAPAPQKSTLVIKDVLKFPKNRAQKHPCQLKPRSNTLESRLSTVEHKPMFDDSVDPVPPKLLPKIPKLPSTPPPSRPPPPPPKKDPRRPSDIATDFLKTGENGKGEGARDTRRPSDIALASLQTVGENAAEGGNDSREPSPIRRKLSFKWEAHLMNEPLYQVYRKTIISKEISRQKISRNSSRTSDDFPAEWTAQRKGSEASPLNGESRGSTLWQDLPKVQESGVLKQLTTKQLKYQESMFEVLTSEASYLRSLRILTEHFLDNRELKETMIIRDRKTLFSNSLKIREVSERFLKDLEDRIFKDIVFPDICDIIHYHAQHNFPAYIDYVRNQIYQEKTFTSLKKTNPQFAMVISHLQESPQCQRLPFISFLLLPFQRITRIKMLIENILRRTVEGTKEEKTATKALDSVSKIIDKCNTEVGKMRQMEELIQISAMLEFDSKLKAIPVISETRYLEKKGELHEMSKGKTLVNMRAKFNPVHLFLFNDLLIIANKKGAERFVVMDHGHRSMVQVQPLEESSGSVTYENCFNLTIVENHQGRAVERLLKAPSQSDMHRWLAAFPDSFSKDEEEKVYEEFDCPQVQCVEQYVAQQADELSLEPADIVNVICKTNEGVYEGIRLSDGQKGWFPVANTIEITNEHVRRKNLLERYRVSQASSMLKDNKYR